MSSVAFFVDALLALSMAVDVDRTFSFGDRTAPKTIHGCRALAAVGSDRSGFLVAALSSSASRVDILCKTSRDVPAQPPSPALPRSESVDEYCRIWRGSRDPEEGV